jgi:phosphate transport system permease protein
MSADSLGRPDPQGKPSTDFDIVPEGLLPMGDEARRHVTRRATIGAVWRRLFLASLFVGVVMLGMLIYNIVNDSFGLVAIQSRVAEQEVTGSPDVAVEDLDQAQLIEILNNELSAGQLRRYLLGLEAASLDELSRGVGSGRA